MIHSVKLECLLIKTGHKKTLAPKGTRVLKSGVDLLSHPQKGSTISASRLNFSVRNGKRWTLLL